MKNKPTIYTTSKPREIYSGVPSFLGLPVVKNKEELKDYDLAIMGVPWEGGCTYGGFSSCTVSPKTIREASIRYSGYLPDYDIDTFDYMSGCDYGDCATKNGDYDYSFAAMQQQFRDIIDAGATPIIFGGDHSISNPLIAELAKDHKKKVGVIHFDAHLDNMPAFEDDPLARCSPFNRLYQNEDMDPTKIVHVGIRGPRNHPQERAEARKYGATVITAMEIKENGWKACIEKALSIAMDGTDVLYVTICSDFLDAASNPQGPIDPCGPTSYDLAMMVHECGKAGACALDFVEIYPENVGIQTSAHVGCWMALYFMNGLTAFKHNL